MYILSQNITGLSMFIHRLFQKCVKIFLPFACDNIQHFTRDLHAIMTAAPTKVLELVLRMIILHNDC